MRDWTVSIQTVDYNVNLAPWTYRFKSNFKKYWSPWTRFRQALKCTMVHPDDIFSYHEVETFLKFLQESTDPTISVLNPLTVMKTCSPCHRVKLNMNKYLNENKQQKPQPARLKGREAKKEERRCVIVSGETTAQTKQGKTLHYLVVIFVI